MSQVNSYDREQYSTNGVAKTFSFGWNVNSKDDIHVKFCRADGTIVDSATFIDSNDDEYTTSTYNYVVELNRQGGTITFTDTPKENQNLIIYRETPLVYENSFKTATAFPAAAIDAAYRKIWLALQEVQSDLVHNTVRLTPNQRGLSFAEFSEAVNNRLVFYDNLTLKYTDFTTIDVANAIQLSASVPQIADTAIEALNKATNALTLAGTINTTLNAHIGNTNNPHRVSLQNLIDTDVASAQYGDYLMFDGIKWVNGVSPSAASWGNISGDIADQTDLTQYVEDAVEDEATLRENADDLLQNQIDDLKGLGRFLSVWNCTTGLPETNPPESPYTYNNGDYFLVGVVGATNYKPNGSSYTIGVASTTVETDTVQVNDVYIYDGTTWRLQENSQRTVAFSGIQGSPYDNTALGNALNSKVDETSTASQVYGTDSNGDQTTYNVSDFGAIEDVQVNSVSVVTNKIANISLSTVATTGDYDDLTNKPTLGTAAAADTTDFATAAQGALADTALQPADLTNYVTTNTTQTITGEKVFSGIMNYSAGKTYILAGNGGTKLGYWSYDIDGQSNITLQTMTASTRNINFKTNNGGKVTYNGSEIAKVSAIPTAVSQLTNDSGYITNAVNDLVNYTPTSSLAAVATTGDYDDLINTPTLASFGITATASEINVLDGITASTTELNYTDGVTSNIQTQLNGKLNYVVADELPEASASTDGKVYYLVNSAREIHPYEGYSIEYTEEAWAEAFLDTSTPTIGGVDIDIITFKDIYQMAYGERSEEWFEEAFEMNPTFTLVKEGDYSVIYWSAYSDITPLDEKIYVAFTFYDEEWEEEIDINDIESATWDVMYYPGFEYTEYGWQALKTTSAIGRWGDIQGIIGDQTDLKNALNAKQDTISDLADIRSGAEAGATAVQPGDLATVATTGDYDDLINKPTIPTVNDSTIIITQGGVTKGSFTLNQASGDTIALDAGGGASLPAGMLATFASLTAPSGWLLCDGSAVSRTSYADLFAAIGTTYGSGDGSTTFNLPDYTNVRDGAFFDYSQRTQVATNVSTYTVTEDGYVLVTGRNIGSWETLSLKVNGNEVFHDRNAYSDANYPAATFATVSNGDVLTITPNENVYFFSAKGVKRPSYYCIKY